MFAVQVFFFFCVGFWGEGWGFELEVSGLGLYGVGGGRARGGEGGLGFQTLCSKPCI